MFVIKCLVVLFLVIFVLMLIEEWFDRQVERMWAEWDSHIQERNKTHLVAAQQYVHDIWIRNN